MRRILGFLFILILFTACDKHSNDTVNGTIDINQCLPNEFGYCLQGEWNFYPENLVTPADLTNLQIQSTQVTVPQSWKGEEIEPDPVTGYYYGTYHIDILNLSSTNRMMFSFQTYKMYIKVFMNGQLTEEFGQFNTNTGEFVPTFGRKVIAFDTNTNQYSIIIQIVSPAKSHGGLKDRVFISSTHVLDAKHKANVFIFFLKFFTLTVMGLYHLMIFIFRPKEKSFLYFGLFTFFLASSYICYEVLELSSHIESYWKVFLKLDKIFLFLSIQMLLGFFYFVYSESKWLKRIKYLGMGVYSILILLVLLMPTQYSYSLYAISQFFTLGLILLMLMSLKKFLFHEGLFRKKDGSTILFIGFLILGLTYFFEGILRDVYYLQFSISDFGVIVFVFCQALFIARRSVKAFNDVEKMSTQLKNRNQELQEAKDELEDRVEERTLELREALEELTVTLEEIKKYQDQIIVQEKLASLGSLTAGIAHEIKNPLNFVNNFSSLSNEMFIELIDLLKSEEVTLTESAMKEIEELVEQIKANLVKIVSHGKRADNIVKSMLEHSRDKGHEKASADINDLLEEDINLAYHGMRARHSDFNVSLETVLDENIPKIDVVSTDLSRVFLNILNNAFYAVYEKSKKESDYHPIVRTQSIWKESNVEISIRDNGYGIPDKIAKNIFNPFFTTKPTGEGNTGLGLSISYDIVVQEHGGTLRFETEPGEYTEFIITLPIL